MVYNFQFCQWLSNDGFAGGTYAVAEHSTGSFLPKKNIFFMVRRSRKIWFKTSQSLLNQRYRIRQQIASNIQIFSFPYWSVPGTTLTLVCWKVLHLWKLNSKNLVSGYATREVCLSDLSHEECPPEPTPPPPPQPTPPPVRKYQVRGAKDLTSKFEIMMAKREKEETERIAKEEAEKVRVQSF